MANSSLSFAKIVATPTENSWAQAYNAGSLFAVLALKKTADIEPESLATIGKEILNILQSEFFVLEDKSLSSLKQVLQKSFEHVPSSLLISFAMAFNRDDLLYLLTLGGGKIIMKRKEATGTLLEQTISEPSQAIHAASGVLESGDLILLQTQEFVEAVSAATLKEALSLELPNDIAETLSPGIHKSEHGASAALILAYHGIAKPEPTFEKEEVVAPAEQKKDTEKETPEDEKENETEEDDTVAQEFEHPHEETQSPSTEEAPEEDVEEVEEPQGKRRLPKLPLPTSFPFSKKVLGLIGLILLILIVLISSIFSTKKQQVQTKNQALFDQIYTSAQKDYDEGVSLLTLNKNLAHDDFVSAQNTLNQANGKFPAGSAEQQKIDDLKKKIADQIGTGGGTSGHTVSATAVSLDTVPLFTVESKKSDYSAFSEDSDTVYAANSSKIIGVGKSDQKEQTLVTNNSDWSTIKGLATYLGNVYLMDQKNGILKFAKASDFSKSSYFKDTAPDLTKAVSMTIDSSIYILFSDGSIKKYTKGSADTFSLSGLTTPFSSPTHIYTTPDFTNLYVLDPGSSRIVVLSKSGAFQKDISASVIKSAKDFTIDSKEQTASVLSGGKAYSLPLK